MYVFFSIFISMYLYGCLFYRAQILVEAGCSTCANHTPESYPESYFRIIPPKNHDFECFL